MLKPESGPYLFDTSAESWLARSADPAIEEWMERYQRAHLVNVSAIGVMERVRGYALLWRSAGEERRGAIEAARLAYLKLPLRVWAVDGAVAVTAGEIMARLSEPPTPPRRTHRLAESRAERLARWRFDCVIAATALVARIPLIHNNRGDFEAVSSTASYRI